MLALQSHRVAGILAAFFAIVFVLADTAEAQNRRRNNNRNRSNNNRNSQQRAQAAAQQAKAIQAQVARAKAALAAATAVGTSAHESVAAAHARAEAAAAAHASAKAAAAEAAKLRADIEQELINGAEGDSEFVRAKESLENAVAEHRAVEQQLLASPEYRAKVATTAPQELAQLRSDTLSSDAEYPRTLATLKDAQTAYQAAMMKMFAADAGWMEASNTSREAQAELAQQENLLRGSLLNRASNAANLRKAAAVAGAAQAAIKQGESAAAKLQQQAKNNNNNNNNNNKNNNKNNKKPGQKK